MLPQASFQSSSQSSIRNAPFNGKLNRREGKSTTAVAYFLYQIMCLDMVMGMVIYTGERK